MLRKWFNKLRKIFRRSSPIVESSDTESPVKPDEVDSDNTNHSSFPPTGDETNPFSSNGGDNRKFSKDPFKTNSNGKSEENVIDLNQETGILLKQIKKEVYPEGIDNPLYQLGKREGESLVLNIKHALLAIEKRYDSFAILLDEYTKTKHNQEIAENQRHIAYLTEEIIQLDKALKEDDEGSEVRRHQQEIKNLEAEISKYRTRIDESSFMDDYNDIWKKRLAAELTEIDELLKNKQELRGQLSTILATENTKLKELIERFLSIDANADVKTVVEQVKVFKNILKHLPITEQKEEKVETNNPPTQEDAPSKSKIPIRWWGKISKGIKNIIVSLSHGIYNFVYPVKKKKNVTTNVNVISITEAIDQKIEELNNKIKSKFDTLLFSLKETKPLTFPRGQIIFNYILAASILMGEFFIVFKFISDLVGFRVRLNDGLWTPIKENPLIILFIIGYTLVIGMVFKLSISADKNKPELRRKLLYAGRILVIIGLVAIAPVAANKIISGEKLIINILGITINYEIIGRTIFLPILTLLFAAIGSILLADTMTMSKQRTHLYRRRLLVPKKGTDPILERLQNQVKGLNDRIKELQDNRSEAKAELAKLQAKSNVETQAPNYKSFIDGLKSIAVNKYISGYKVGRAEKLATMEADDLYLINLKQNFLEQNEKE